MLAKITLHGLNEYDSAKLWVHFSMPEGYDEDLVKVSSWKTVESCRYFIQILIMCPGGLECFVRNISGPLKNGWSF